ncbi:hypothetical protein JOF56_009157 [Kibdelosporangium banguiense]|uniref:Uncharacterized protein n=1 Tax=Kibdelosporangium banguiense TaxID=1365924 RepID=A0ABS4TWJ6_9PSEU|nr:hypothetical protein [Kibdelosporangium banguiense]MBP2328772.1 hypothetical protein [Kibdelosporangium banguiense]
MSSVRLQGRPDEQLSSWLWLVKWFLVIPHLIVLVRINADSSQRLFIGIGPADDVSRYLSGIAYDRARTLSPVPMWRGRRMAGQFALPEEQQFWSVSVVGSGPRRLSWNVPDGQWTLVVLNADTTSGVEVDLSAGATVPGLLPLGAGLLGAGWSRSRVACCCSTPVCDAGA